MANLQITGHPISDNFWHKPVTDLMPPAYLWINGSKVAHIVDPNTFSVAVDPNEDGSYDVDHRAKLDLRCFRGFCGNPSRASAVKPAHLQLCKRCAKVVGTALLGHITGKMVGPITKAVQVHYRLGFHPWEGQCPVGNRMSDKVRPLRGPKPGTITFLFLHKKMCKIDIPLLDIENWKWLTEQPNNNEWGTWIGNEIVRRKITLERDQKLNFQAWHALEEDVLEDRLFEDL